MTVLRHAVLIRDHVCTVIKFSLSDLVSSVSPQGHGFGVQEWYGQVGHIRSFVPTSTPVVALGLR